MIMAAMRLEKLRQVDLNLLITFAAIAEEKSITAAASRLLLSQPAVSRALQRARAMFQDDLLVRSPQGFELTLRGRTTIRVMCGFAWAEVERQHLHIDQVDFRGRATFTDLLHHYAQHELGEPTESIHPKAHTAIRGCERVLRNRLLPRWGNRVALSLEPLEVGLVLDTEQSRLRTSDEGLRRLLGCFQRVGKGKRLCSQR